jgi:anti-sigma B factor antagonist
MLTVVQRRVPRPSRLTGVGDPTVEISTTRDEDRVVLTVRGEIDMATAPMLNHALARAAGVGATEICVDLRDVGFMDSTGLHALVEIHEAIDRSRRRLVIIAPTGAARRTLELSGLMGVLNIAG